MKTKKKYNTNKKNKNYSRKIVRGGAFMDKIRAGDDFKKRLVKGSSIFSTIKDGLSYVPAGLLTIIPGVSTLLLKRQKSNDDLKVINKIKTKLRSFVKIEILNSLKKIIKKDGKYYTGEELGKIIFFYDKI